MPDDQSLVKCWVGPCGYPAMGMVSTIQTDDSGDEFLAITLSPRPVADDGTDVASGPVFLCRHHIVERVETHTRAASRREARA